jgi:Flp pilus assembly protein TadD
MRRGVFFLCAILAATTFGATAPRPRQRPPFSIEALQYLLRRQEYDRFDWYIVRYLRHHPDTAVLHLIRAYRYFDQALKTEVYTRHAISGPTGGIPRKYPEYVAPRQVRADMHSFPVYNDNLLRKAFAAMRTARTLEPKRRDLYTGICHMAAQAHLPRVLAAELDTLLQRFPCDSEVVSITIGYARDRLIDDDAQSAIRLLKRIAGANTGDARLLGEIGRAYYHMGEIDSSYKYTLSAHYLAPDDTESLMRAVRLSAIQGEYKAGAHLALKRYAVTRDRIDLDQAIILTEAYDSAGGAQLRASLADDSGPADSASLYARYRRLLRAAETDSSFFADSMYHLNFPLIEMKFRRGDDRISYYLHKASAFYGVALYDSAAYYNLNLLRNLDGERNLGLSAGFNLAAEYYASGRHMLAFQRFLKIYKYTPFPSDLDLHYALAVNYETFGDLSNARAHYRRVIREGAEREGDQQICRLARYRLDRLRSAGRSAAR